MADRDAGYWINIGGSVASFIALGYIWHLFGRDRPGKKITISGLGARPKRGGLDEVSFDLAIEDKPTSEDTYFRVDVKVGGKRIGFVSAFGACRNGDWAQIGNGIIEDRKFQGIGLYPTMLKKLRDAAKSAGCKGLVSRAENRYGFESTESWAKFATREPKVSAKAAFDSSGYPADDYYLEGLGRLPKKGRIPMATVKRVAKKLPKWTQKCGFTMKQLREGMEVEREHRDVTRGGVLKTAKIATAHLCEQVDYYRRLKRFVER